MKVFLSRGACGREVKVLQASLGFLLGIRLAADGCYGQETAKWLRRWQAKQGLPQTGDCDLKTWETLLAALCPPERHLQLLLPWSLLQVREGSKVLFARPLKGALTILSPGMACIDTQGSRQKSEISIKLSNGVSFCTAPGRGRSSKGFYFIGAGQPVAELTILTKRGMRAIINPLPIWPALEHVPLTQDEQQTANRVGASLRRIKKTLIPVGEGTNLLPISRVPWPIFLAQPSGEPKLWEPWLPWLRGLIVPTEERRAWVSLARDNGVRLLALTPGGSRLPRVGLDLCYQVTEAAVAGALQLRTVGFKGKRSWQAISLAHESLVPLLPVTALAADFFILPVPGERVPEVLDCLRQYISPERLLLATTGDKAPLVAWLVKTEGLGGLVLTSPPEDPGWLSPWIES